jgi:hypothetical protein
MESPTNTAELLAETIRPDGRTYRPRKRPVAVVLEDADDAYAWIYVLRTHDVDRALDLARMLAQREGLEIDATRPPALIWTRVAIRNWEREYVDDPVRGVPAVTFKVW